MNFRDLVSMPEYGQFMAILGGIFRVLRLCAILTILGPIFIFHDNIHI